MPKGDLVEVLTNGSLHQVAMKLTGTEKNQSEILTHTFNGYHLPYTYLRNTPKKALVIGSGTGNDVSVMLAEGIEKIDAVEIDPIILEIGQKSHPDSPYGSPRVRVFNTDARSFLNNTTEKYDIVVFGTLDSMTRLSALSNVRLDNFVYTVECIDASKSLLKPDGGIIMYFMVVIPFIHQK